MDATGAGLFVNFLKSLNFDLKDFLDLSFDGMTYEPGLKNFLFWLCSSFDADNVITEEEAESLALLQDENLENIQEHNTIDRGNIYNYRMYNDLLACQHVKLHRFRGVLSNMQSLEENLTKKEKEYALKMEISKKELMSVVEEDESKTFKDELSKALVQCMSIKPFNLDLSSFKEVSDCLGPTLDDFFNENVINVEQEIELKPSCDLENLEQVLIESQLSEDLSVCRVKNAMVWLNEEQTMDQWSDIENLTLDTDAQKNSKLLVEKKLRSREANYLKRKIALNNYLNSALSLNCKLLFDCYISLLIGQALVEKRCSAIQVISSNIGTFISSLKNETELINTLNESGNNVDSTEVTRRFLPCQHTNVTNCLVDIYKKKHEMNCLFRGDVIKILAALRSGPTRRISFVPPELLISLFDCQSSRNHLAQELRKLAAAYTEQKKKHLNNPKRGEQLLWVSFLTSKTSKKDETQT